VEVDETPAVVIVRWPAKANYLAPAPLSRRPSIERAGTAVSDGMYGSFRDRADSGFRASNGSEARIGVQSQSTRLRRPTEKGSRRPFEKPVIGTERSGEHPVASDTI